jgi:hypothetical protein
MDFFWEIIFEIFLRIFLLDLFRKNAERSEAFGELIIIFWNNTVPATSADLCKQKRARISWPCQQKCTYISWLCQQKRSRNSWVLFPRSIKFVYFI